MPPKRIYRSAKDAKQAKKIKASSRPVQDRRPEPAGQVIVV